LKGRLHSKLAALPFFVIVGGMCYTIYLYHPAIKAVVGPWIVHAFPAAAPPLLVLCAQLAAFGLAIICICIPLFLCFEKPFMAFRAKGAS
jgi:peptidoglycan/LPS O-acetylase OafA/YrhL